MLRIQPHLKRKDMIAKAARDAASAAEAQAAKAQAARDGEARAQAEAAMLRQQNDELQALCGRLQAQLQGTQANVAMTAASQVDQPELAAALLDLQADLVRAAGALVEWAEADSAALRGLQAETDEALQQQPR